jgi:DNA-binding response OmpR family regulator
VSRILLIEDEASIGTVVKQGLEEEGFAVDWARDGSEGLERALERPYGLIILDLLMPKTDGREVCRRLREEHDPTPILMLTALTSLEDRVNGLDLGADDYLNKPFHFTELLARIRALLRRHRLYKSRNIQIDDLQIDTYSRLVTRNGEQIDLTNREYLLLEALAGSEGQVITRETIQERVWLDDVSYMSTSNTVDVHVAQLRKKIDQNYEVKLIHTVRGAGYALRRSAD